MDPDKSVSPDDVRRQLREILNEVEHDGAHFTIKRYDIPAAVMVPVDFYRSARQALGFPDPADHETPEGER